MIEKLQKKMQFICLAVLAGIATIQLIYALIWAFHNGNNIQDFYDTSIYLQNAVILSSDGWRLIGYSCFLVPFVWMSRFLGDYYTIAVYLCQSVVALLCFAKGIQAVGKLLTGCQISYPKALIPSGYILTLPIVWQMQFAILPDALCLSLLVLLSAYLIELFYVEERFFRFSVMVVAGILLFLGITQRHYFYGALCLTAMHAVVMIIRMIIKRLHSKKNIFRILSLVALLVVAPLLTTVANNQVTDVKDYATYSPQADSWKRFVYPNIYQNYELYTERIKAVIPEEEALLCEEFYEYYMMRLGPMIEQGNSQQAKEIYLEVAQIGFESHKKDLIKNSVKELIAYTFIPVAMEKYMYNNNDSLYGHNAIKMYEMSPKLTMDYMHIAMNGFCVISLIGIVANLGICVLDKEQRRKRPVCLGYGIASILVVTFPMMLFAIVGFDYRIGLFSAFLWCAYSLVTIMLDIIKEKEVSQKEK